MARFDLGLSDAEFWSMHPARYVALVRRWDWQQRRADARAAQVAATIANVNRDPEARPEPYELDDFTAGLALLPMRPKWMTREGADGE